MSENILVVTESNFEQEVLNSPIPVLVDFWAEWCGPCKALAPTLDRMAAHVNYQGKIKVTKLNVDESSVIAAKYGVKSIPTLIVFKEGQVEATKVGMLTESQLTAFIDPHL